ncbi:GntR family transcriptional regulator [Paenibacillus herberti]|uniref:Transcriptional regulator n=1 Tax=Paenibacillus herberti TaxID=1619309 RepID=A0A229P1F7_9BACL|nr:GntR family transcriptional regulator [Paenibacillus herberti]OXM16073.1 transcriptional regulator [Paenibacillus herberti]
MSPRYMQIKNELEDQINRGILPAGYRFPSELEMAAKFGVSRETFRTAVKRLEEEGKVRVQHGVGTFVIRQLDHVPSNLTRLQSTSEMLQAAGRQESDQHQSVLYGECKEEWASILNIGIGDPVIILERDRTANGEPVMSSIYILPRSIVGNAFDNTSFSGSLLHFLEQKLGIFVKKSQTEIKVPQQADPHVKVLMVRPSTTVLLMKQTHYDENNFPIFYAYDYFRNDVFQFWVDRVR